MYKFFVKLGAYVLTLSFVPVFGILFILATFYDYCVDVKNEWKKILEKISDWCDSDE